MKTSILIAILLVILLALFYLFSSTGLLGAFEFVKYVLFQGIGLALALLALVIFVAFLVWRMHSRIMGALAGVFLIGILLFVFAPSTSGLLEYPALVNTFGPGKGPQLPFKNVLNFFQNFDQFEEVDEIARDPNEVPPPIDRDSSEIVEVNLEAKEVLSEMGEDITFNYWTFDGQVPGPLIRVREGDTVKLSLKNDLTSLHDHSIDLHAVTGPGGGAAVTRVKPGETKTLQFKTLNPGVFVYHCAVPNVANHMAHGMYGLIIVEPEEGLPEVDKEFYIMQGEFYSTGKLGKKGLQVFDAQKMLDGNPNYVVFNGRTGGVTGKMKAEVGDRVRVYFGNGGVNLISSFHLIGEIFDRVYHEASFSSVHENIQTTLVPAGGATVAEFDLDYPGNYIFVDHALARLDKGAWGVLEVTGEENPEIYKGE